MALLYADENFPWPAVEALRLDRHHAADQSGLSDIDGFGGIPAGWAPPTSSGQRRWAVPTLRELGSQESGGWSVGYQVEYFLKLSPRVARKWLSGFEGFWVKPEASVECLSGEFRLRDDLELLAELAEPGCWLRVPQIKYSWLISGHQGSVAQIDGLEQLLAESLPRVPIIRVDEFIRQRWEAAVERSWDQQSDPIASLRNWLISSKQDPSYYRLVCDLSHEAAFGVSED